MSGIAAPQYPIIEPFGLNGMNPADLTLPIPVPSQQLIKVGAASFADGFPPATRIDPTAGGEPPYGQDMNGLLYMVTAYCAMLQAGQIVPYSAFASTAFGGYAAGARLASIATPGRIWINTVAGNSVDPDADQTGWRSSDPQYVAFAPAGGTYNNQALPGASDYAYDVDTSAGDVTFTGFIARYNGQQITYTNTGANRLRFDGGSAGGGDTLVTEGGDTLVTEGGDTLVTDGGGGGSASANQIRNVEGGITLLRWDTLTLRYFYNLQKWLSI